MEHFLWMGTVLGVTFGLLHGFSVYRNRVADEGAGPFRALYFGAWAVALWTLFGAYLLAFWLLGAFGMTASRVLRAREPRT